MMISMTNSNYIHPKIITFMKKYILSIFLAMLSLMGFAQTASDNYLDIANYTSIDNAGWRTSLINNLYKYTEDAENECAWLTLPVYGAFVGARYATNSSTVGSGHPQKWIECSLGTSNTYGGTTWNNTSPFCGSSTYFTSTTARAIGYNSRTNTTARSVSFYVTNITEVSLFGTGRSGASSLYPARLRIYECTKNANGTVTASSTATVNQTNSTTSTFTLQSGTLEATKIYKVEVSICRGYLYEIAFKTPLPKITSNQTSLNISSRVNSSETMSFNVKGSHLRGDINVALEDANNVFSIAPETITQSEATSTTGKDVTVTFTPTSLGTFTGKVKLSSTGAPGVEVNITGTALTPDLKVTPESLTFDAENTTPIQESINVQAENLGDVVTVALEDENNVFSISQESISIADAENGTSVNVTFTPPSEYGVYEGVVKFSTSFVDEIRVPVTATYYPASFKVSISSYGLSTLYLDFPVEIPYDTYADDLLGVFFAYEATGTEVKMARIRQIIPANEGVVVEGNSGDYVFPRYKGTDIPPLPRENILLGSVKNIPVSQFMEGKTGTLLALGKSKEGGYIGFFRYTGSTLLANKAFLIYEDESNANALSISGLGGDYTGISEVNTDKGDGTWYTIQGMRLNGTPKQQGIYIRNGKTVVVK